MNNSQKKLEKVCDNIRGIRELKGITRDAMAFELDITASGYGKIERGEVDISLKKVFQIASILQVDIDQIINTDVSQVFNISNNQNVQGVGAKSPTFNNSGNAGREEIEIIRKEIDELRKLIQQNKIQ